MSASTTSEGDSATTATFTRRERESLDVAVEALADYVVKRLESKGFVVKREDDSPSKRDGSQDSSGQKPKPGPDDKHTHSNENYADLMGECNRFEYAFYSIGSGGPGIEAITRLKKALRRFHKLARAKHTSNAVIDGSSLDLQTNLDVITNAQELFITLGDLETAIAKLRVSLMDFTNMFYNEKLIQTLVHLEKVLTECRSAVDINGEPVIKERKYIDDLIPNLESSFDTLSKELADFVDRGIPVIKTAQQTKTDRLLQITTISTFLSGVTVSTLQIQMQNGVELDALNVAVNVFFFSSLIFSTASAVQSTVAMMWLRSFIRLPETLLPRWMSFWLTKGPTTSLLIAGAFFSMGLVLFAYASGQHSVTSILTTSFAAIQVLALVILCTLFNYERWQFKQDTGDIGHKLMQGSLLFSFIEGLSTGARSLGGGFAVIGNSVPRSTLQWWPFRRSRAAHRRPGETRDGTSNVTNHTVEKQPGPGHRQPERRPAKNANNNDRAQLKEVVVVGDKPMGKKRNDVNASQTAHDKTLSTRDASQSASPDESDELHPSRDAEPESNGSQSITHARSPPLNSGMGRDLTHPVDVASDAVP